ncbi:unnamed protein product, partial [Strongylus vulgaris]
MATGSRIPENYETLTPILKAPVSDTFAVPLSQQGRICGFFEAQFFRCMEAYGAKLGRKYCDLEHRDFRECLTGDKQKKVDNVFYRFCRPLFLALLLIFVFPIFRYDVLISIELVRYLMLE